MWVNPEDCHMRRRRLESYDDYERAPRNSFGRGCCEDYTPWIRT